MSIEHQEGLVYMDGYNNCLIGHVTTHDGNTVPVYGYDKLVLQHVRDGMTMEEAVDFIEYNQIGSCVSEYMPLFLFTI